MRETQWMGQRICRNIIAEKRKNEGKTCSRMRRKILGGKFSGTVKRSSDLYSVCGGGDFLLLREYGDMAIILAVVLLNATVE